MKIGSVWQRVVPVLFIYLLFAVTQLVLCREEEDSVTGEADTTGLTGDSEESVFVGRTATEAKSFVCSQTILAFNTEFGNNRDLFAEWLSVLQTRNYFSTKPISRKFAQSHSAVMHMCTSVTNVAQRNPSHACNFARPHSVETRNIGVFSWRTHILQ